MLVINVMGVPSFFAWWVKHYAHRILSNRLKASKNVVLYLDFNGIIHPATRTDPDLPRDLMNEAVCDYFYKIVQTVRPNEIYIAIDGVAPLAKMDQQRDRRFKSAKESKIKRDISLKHGQPTREEQVDFNMISPGTEFMWGLQQYLEQYISTKRATEWRGIKVTLNGSGLPGEGEHKIMAEIRRRNNGSGGTKRTAQTSQTLNCIYGLDADLMFLSLLNAPESVLVRENVFFQGRDKLDLNPETYPYVYLDIAALKEIMVQTLKPSTTMEMLAELDFLNTIGEYDGEYRTAHYSGSDQDKHRLVLDYTYICFFLGNDFLPRLPCLKIRGGSLNDVIILYKRVSWILGDYIIQRDHTVNRKFLQYFLDEIAYIENELLMKQSEQRYKDISKYRFRLQGKTPYEKELEDFNYVENKYTDTIEAGTPGWRVRYYGYHLKWPYHHDSEFERNLLPVCQAYLQGTIWVLQYYLGLHDSWNWIYPYAVAPAAQDLANALEAPDGISLDITFPKDEPATPYVQLLSILPPDSALLLPPALQSLMTSKDSPIHYMYPLKIVLSLIGNKFWYECRAWLPHVDQASLNTIVQSKYQYLTQEEQQRNSRHNIVTWK